MVIVAFTIESATNCKIWHSHNIYEKNFFLKSGLKDEMESDF